MADEQAPLEPGEAALAWHQKERAHTDDALRVLRELDGAQDMRAVTKVAATVGAHSNRELASVVMAAADTVAGDLREAARHVDAASAALGARIDAFTTATDASTRQLASWTKVMAIATAALVLTGVVQIVLALLHKTG